MIRAVSELGASVFGPGTEIVAFPSRSRVSMLYRGGDLLERWSRAGLRRHYRILGRLKSMALRTSAVFPARLNASTHCDQVLHAVNRFGETLEGDPVAVFLGKDHRTAKFVVEYMDGAEKRGFAKFGLGADAASLVRNEVALMNRLPTGSAPEVASVVEMTEGIGFATRVLPGRPAPALPPGEEFVRDYLSRLGSGARVAGGEHPVIKELLPAFQGRLGQHLKVLSSVELDHGFQHGDLVSWNVFLGEQGEWSCVDWESGRAAGAPLLDLLYWGLQLDCVGSHRSPGRAVRRCLTWLERVGRPAPSQEGLALVGCCAAQVLARFGERTEEGIRSGSRNQLWWDGVLSFSEEQLAS